MPFADAPDFFPTEELTDACVFFAVVEPAGVAAAYRTGTHRVTPNIAAQTPTVLNRFVTTCPWDAPRATRPPDLPLTFNSKPRRAFLRTSRG
ncbi:MAG: hypothetical protein NVSMB62_14050 [Acidobacteriaceae bacterium]